MAEISHGQVNLNTVLGAIGTAGAVAPGILGNLFGGMGSYGNGSSDNMPVNRYEAGQNARIAQLETEVRLRDANTYVDSKLLEMYKYVDGKFARVEHQLCEQSTWNATQTGTISCMAQQIAQLQGLTKLVIPNGSVCPGWDTTTTTTT